MKTETIGMCVVALLLGMLLANMLKDVCGCNVEGMKKVKGPPAVTFNVYQKGKKGTMQNIGDGVGGNADVIVKK